MSITIPIRLDKYRVATLILPDNFYSSDAEKIKEYINATQTDNINKRAKQSNVSMTKQALQLLVDAKVVGKGTYYFKEINKNIRKLEEQ